MALLVLPHLGVDAPEELRPDRVDKVPELSQPGARDLLCECGVGLKVDRLRVLQVDASGQEVFVTAQQGIERPVSCIA